MSGEIGTQYTCGGCGAKLFVPQQRYHAKAFHSFSNGLARAGWKRVDHHLHICPDCPQDPTEYAGYENYPNK